MSTAQRLDWTAQPLDVLRRWPRSVALAALLSGDDSNWSRVSVIGVPNEWKMLRARDGLTPQDVADWIRSLDGPRAATTTLAKNEPPMGAGWFTQFSYELGGVLEPMARASGHQFKVQSNNDTRKDGALRGGETKSPHEKTRPYKMEDENNTG